MVNLKETLLVARVVALPVPITRCKGSDHVDCCIEPVDLFSWLCTENDTYEDHCSRFCFVLIGVPQAKTTIRGATKNLPRWHPTSTGG